MYARLTHRRFDTTSDVYAFGVTFWEIMSNGKRPWKHVVADDVISRVSRGEKLPHPKRCPPAVYGIMEVCWALDREKRPTFDGIAQMIRVIQETISHDMQAIRCFGGVVTDAIARQSKASGASRDGEKPLTVADFEVDRDSLKLLGELGAGEFGEVVLMEASGQVIDRPSHLPFRISFKLTRVLYPTAAEFIGCLTLFDCRCTALNSSVCEDGVNIADN